MNYEQERAKQGIFRSHPYVADGNKYRYSRDCSIFYSTGEIIVWNNIRDEEIDVHAVSAEKAMAVMNGWKENAPAMVRARVLGIC